MSSAYGYRAGFSQLQGRLDPSRYYSSRDPSRLAARVTNGLALSFLHNWQAEQIEGSALGSGGRGSLNTESPMHASQIQYTAVLQRSLHGADHCSNPT